MQTVACEPVSQLGSDFLMRHLSIRGINNAPVLAANDPFMVKEEICLHHCRFSDGQGYLDSLHSRIQESMSARSPFPVVRFADGEYAFYDRSLSCNGLYQQARSVQEIEQAFPMHRKALARLAAHGLLAPLIHEGNSLPPQSPFFRLFKKRKGDDSACRFLRFLSESEIQLTAENYLPFYCVYAYLSSRRFAELIHGRHLCFVSSEIDEAACRRWFAQRGSAPEISSVSIPESYLATQWEGVKEDILAKVPREAALCLVGAGIGALLVCVDLAERKGVPVIDAGHVLNMINGRVDKSNGDRLFTIWQD